MRTLDPILENALSEQQGAIILRVNTWTDAADYASNPTAPDHVWTCRSFEIGATTAEAELVTENDYTLSAFTVFTIERGVKLSGVEYTIESGLMHVRKYKEEYGKISITGSSYPNQKINITAGDGTYQEVIEAFCTEIGKTAVFKNSTDAWLDYQFLPDGKTLSLNKAELFESLLKQKYTILVYEESPNNLVFYNQDSYSASDLNAVTENNGLLVAVAGSQSEKVLTSEDANIWTERTATNFQNDVTYSPTLGLYVAVGASVAASSPDGITWTVRTIPAGTYTSIAWSPALGMFVAVGTNVCATSTNGTTWTARTITAGNYVNVTWSISLAMFLAISEKIMTSTNGTTWTLIGGDSTWTAQAEAGTATYISIAWSPELELFAAISRTGLVMTSPDGKTWTARTAAEANNWTDIAWSPALGMFAAISNTGTNRVMTSTDGITWTARSAAAASTYNGIAWSPALGMFAAVAADGAVMTSTNGTTWTARTAAEANNWTDITWSPALGIFCAVAQTGTNRVMTSTDGTTWTARAAAEANQWYSVAWSPELGMFAAVAISGTNRVMTSTDGTTWTAQAAAEANTWRAVAWSPELGMFAAVSDSGTNRVMVSTNGTSWTSQTAAEANNWRGIAWAPALGMFAAVSDSGTNAVMTSYSLQSGLKSCTWSEEKSLFVLVGTNICYTSPNGTTWTSRAIPTGTYNSVTYSPALILFIAVGSGVAASSPDGTTWTARTPVGTGTWKDIVYSTTLSLLVAVASDGLYRVMTSTNGTTWTAQTTTSDFDLSYLDGPRSYLDRQQSAVHYLWRDEVFSLHTSGDTNNPQWNLGYLHSTASPPTTREDAYYKIFLQKAPVRLDITDSDKIHFTPFWSIDPSQTIDAMMQITEHFNTKESPSWYQEIRSIVLFDKTEGGALPSTIERVAAYTPLVSTGFDGNLTPSVNNLQALAQAVDDLPRSLTTTERDAIATPRAGLTIYNSTTLKLNFYDGSAWRVVTST